MAYILIQLLINLILLWHRIHGTVVDCTVYPVMLQPVPARIVATIAIANQSNEEVYWNEVFFNKDEQFPLKFSVVIYNYEIIAGNHTLQLHIYKLPRNNFDLPLWSADQRAYLTPNDKPILVPFMAHSTSHPIGPCIIGIIVNTDDHLHNIQYGNLNVKVGGLQQIGLKIVYPYFPIHFMIPNISIPDGENSTNIKILMTSLSSSILYQATKIVNLNTGCNGNGGCDTILFKVSEAKNMNLTVTMSAHVFTSISQLALAVMYRIYDGKILVFEKTETAVNLKFPFIIPETLIPISISENYTIEATIFGNIPEYGFDGTFFEGVTYARLVPHTNNHVKISMLYTGPKLGTTIIGTVQQTPHNQSTWPLVNSSLVFAIADEMTGLDESYQFIIYDQTFPIQFTLISVKAINRSHENVVFTVTITYQDDTLLWTGMTASQKIIFGDLNRISVDLSIADGYTCLAPGKGSCSHQRTNLNSTCCSEYKCSSGQCMLP